ncbi:MAG TPA: ergothioneine biosynthesis protein EgtB [Xanthomonadaceae bacterium]|nr:ergothioneine biosynthesis protein EgtB [Xanthomonadaceae bacterium]
MLGRTDTDSGMIADPLAPVASTPPAAAPPLALRYRAVRAGMAALARGLSGEDLAVQSMPDASPGKWHLAHTSWFFEVMVLEPHAGLAPLRPDWLYLFNSYYDALGERHPRPQRGLLTRPSLEQVLAYRAEVDVRMLEFLATDPATPAQALVELGLQHEQQHQELFVTDLKHLLSHNPLAPAWRVAPARTTAGANPPLRWIAHGPAGPVAIGAEGPDFAFDNERPRHSVWLEPFALASRPVTCGDWLAFIEAAGYRDPTLWLADGWDAVQAGGWQAPLYWRRGDAGWQRYSVHGPVAIDPAEPVAHVSYYEADAYARWAGARLPTEAEWEAVACGRVFAGAFADDGRLEPAPVTVECFGGNVWEWTSSAYSPYPGFRALTGAAGEYNGKFMSGQMVLRGGSCASPRDHVRSSYRNFFPPAARWQYSGLRLAKDQA